MDVLGNLVRSVSPGGAVLDLQVIRPNPRVEVGDELVCEVDGEPLFRRADAAAAAIDALVQEGRLAEEAVDDHDVRTHYPSGADMVQDFEDKVRRLPPEALPALRSIRQPCVLRERCRLRRLRVSPTGG